MILHHRGFKVSEVPATIEHAAAPVVAHHAHVAHQFDDLEQQHEADTLGMWIFLSTEVLFFSALFTAYATYRFLYPEGFLEASHHLNWPIGAINTGVLLCSSLSVALAVHAAQHGHQRRLVLLLLITMALGATFLGIKAYEYYVDYEEGLIPGLNFTQTGPHAQQVALFFVLYFTMTGIHAFHMIIGLGVFALLAFLAWRGRFTPGQHMPVELTGLYWHFVDIVWVFLYPMLYLVG